MNEHADIAMHCLTQLESTMLAEDVRQRLNMGMHECMMDNWIMMGLLLATRACGRTITAWQHATTCVPQSR